MTGSRTLKSRPTSKWARFLPHACLALGLALPGSAALAQASFIAGQDVDWLANYGGFASAPAHSTFRDGVDTPEFLRNFSQHTNSYLKFDFDSSGLLTVKFEPNQVEANQGGQVVLGTHSFVLPAALSWGAISKTSDSFSSPGWTASIDALNPQTLTLTMGNQPYSAPQLFKTATFEFSVNAVNTGPNVSAVPEPSAAFLAAGGLVVLALLRRRRTR